ncbi:MAG: hypothetical protein EOP53_14670 [Sphingobacteriales bacterium]|nr:MAG: hypothetical protein EOP53_14670 [Sphingobacteriales bacterium]
MLKNILFIFLLLLTACCHAQVKTLKEYYPTGNIKSITHEGIFNGCNMKLGTDSIFYENGRLMTTIQYNNRKDRKNAACHATWTIESTTHYYINGKIKSRSQQKYVYEGEPCDCGTWMRYDEKGRLVKKIIKAACYNQTPCTG